MARDGNNIANWKFHDAGEFSGVHVQIFMFIVVENIKLICCLTPFIILFLARIKIAMDRLINFKFIGNSMSLDILIKISLGKAVLYLNNRTPAFRNLNSEME